MKQVEKQLSDIMIAPNMAKTKPNAKKVKKAKEFFNIYHCTDKPIVINKHNILTEGYAQYWALCESGATSVMVNVNQNCTTKLKYRNKCVRWCDMNENTIVDNEDVVNIDEPLPHNIATQYSTSITLVYDDIVKTYEKNAMFINQCEEELLDLEHEIELSDDKNMYAAWEIYRAIKDVRTRRRVAKDENQVLQEMYNFIKSKEGEAMKVNFQKMRLNSSKVSVAQQHRIYIPRQRTDLTISKHMVNHGENKK